jgi:hypothetical protein
MGHLVTLSISISILVSSLQPSSPSPGGFFWLPASPSKHFLKHTVAITIAAQILSIPQRPRAFHSLPAPENGPNKYADTRRGLQKKATNSCIGHLGEPQRKETTTKGTKGQAFHRTTMGPWALDSLGQQAPSYPFRFRLPNTAKVPMKGKDNQHMGSNLRCSNLKGSKKPKR